MVSNFKPLVQMKKEDRGSLMPYLNAVNHSVEEESG